MTVQGRRHRRRWRAHRRPDDRLTRLGGVARPPPPSAGGALRTIPGCSGSTPQTHPIRQRRRPPRSPCPPWSTNWPVQIAVRTQIGTGAAPTGVTIGTGTGTCRRKVPEELPLQEPFAQRGTRPHRRRRRTQARRALGVGDDLLGLALQMQIGEGSPRVYEPQSLRAPRRCPEPPTFFALARCRGALGVALRHGQAPAGDEGTQSSNTTTQRPPHLAGLRARRGGRNAAPTPCSRWCPRSPALLVLVVSEGGARFTNE